MTKNKKKLDRMARRAENQSYYCWLINERTGNKKLVSKSVGYIKSQGFINSVGVRVKPWKDTYRVEDI